MWNEPYLETCCRSALHRLCVCDAAGCLERLAAMGLARQRRDERFDVTDNGRTRHDSEIMRNVVPAR